MSHSYTIDEIDRMRAALQRKLYAMIPPLHHEEGAVYFGASPFDHYKAAQEAVPARAEDELRTAMIGGVRPEELEAKYPPHPSPAGQG